MTDTPAATAPRPASARTLAVRASLRRRHASEAIFRGLGLLAIIAALGFAGKAIFIKLVYAASPNMDAVTLLALRMLFALPFFAVLY